MPHHAPARAIQRGVERWGMRFWACASASWMRSPSFHFAVRSERAMPKRGLLVTEIDIQKQLRMLELRREVELLIARRAARLASPEERQELRQIAEDMAAAGRADDQDAFTTADRQLNRMIAECGRNEFATEAMDQVQGLSRRFWYCYQARFADVATATALHQSLALEIAGGDEAAAGRASDTLLDYVESFTHAVLEES
jgi:DNA-binding GntR family transcriptional regulator